MGAGVLDVLIGVVVGVVLGTAATYCLEWLRERKHAKADRESLAGALAAELDSFRQLLEEWKNSRQGFDGDFYSDRQPIVGKIMAGLALNQSYCSVYDSAGPMLHSLRPLVRKVAVCYFRVKLAVDSLYSLRRAADYADVQADMKKRDLQFWLKGTLSMTDENVDGALTHIRGVLPELCEQAKLGGTARRPDVA